MNALKTGLLGLIFLLMLAMSDAHAQYTPPLAKDEPSHGLQAVSTPFYGSAQVAAAQEAGDYFPLQKKIVRWSDQTRFVLVYVSTAAYLPDWQPWNVQIVKDALSEWQRALDNRLMFVFVNDPSQADVVVNWWNTTTPSVEKGACGLNQYRLWGKYLAKNDIYISLHDTGGQPWSSQQLYITALHESGHMIGIREHSDRPGDVMSPASNAPHLQPRDINTMRRIYAAKANYVNPPGYHLSHFEDFRKTQRGGFWIPIIIPIPL